MALDTTTAQRHRLVTRSDFDGLVCAALLKELGMLDDILFVHPKDMQDGRSRSESGDITTNLPYVPGVGLAFDHHASEAIRVEDSPENAPAWRWSAKEWRLCCCLRRWPGTTDPTSSVSFCSS